MSSATLAPASRLVTLPEGEPTYTLGCWAIWWAESFLVQPNGPRAGKPLRFTGTQRRFLLWWYAVDAEGRWLFHHGARRLSKGSGKSPFAAAVALIELCAPVRLVHLDVDRTDARLAGWGWCVGKPVDLPLVQIAATAESQTFNTMRMVRAFAPKGSRVVEEHLLDPGKTKYYKLPEGQLEVITSSATAAEGAEATFIVGDETEHWRPSNGGDDLSETLEDNLAKSGSRMLETSNAWIPGQQSVAESTYDAWLLQEEGRTKSDRNILYDARIAPPDTDLSDEGSLRAALEHVYDDCFWVDIDTIVGRVWSPKAKPDASRRKYLDQPTAAEDAWTTPQQWAALADPTVVVADGDEIVMFFDGSKSRDATALVGCRLDDGHVFEVGVWEPDQYDPDSTVDAADVDRVVSLAFDRWKVVAFFADVREWEQFALTTWPQRWGDQLDVKAVPSGRPPHPVAWDMRSHRDEFAKAAEACLAEIEDAAFTHCGSSATARHVGNCKRRPYKAMVTVGKETADSPRKIDAAVCVIGARMVRRLVLADPKRKRRRAGQFRGMKR